ncbi:PAS domain S-box protein [Methanoculleus sp. Wushi-C6]|uniref:PAS domain S-box protein n=1 Tax=Methanoculleus caldifontis TaxID=2651577 RepID=A0ABU3X1D3_9EURY|nr:PAS domain S-box protein [Methanoculleus sp. Wushi-C6]MDV2481872.1 PAS domain S-box protein [Methanoculleus sp. Wushi-C6]
MDTYWKETLRIRELLNAHPRGMTISELSRRLQVTRNSVAKYLDVLLSTGQIEMQKIGSAKLYFLSERIPLSALLYLHSDAMVVLDDEGRIVLANDPFLNLAAVSRESILDQEARALDIAPLNDPRIVSAIGTLSRGPLTVPNLVHVDGDVGAYLRVKIFPTVLEGGRPGTSIVFEDVTDQIRVHLELGTERARLRAIFDSAPEAIVVTDEDGRVRMLNPAAESLGIAPRLSDREDETAASSQIRHPCDRTCDPHDLPLVRSAKHGETVRGVHLRLVCTDGEDREILANTAPITEASGRRIGAVGIFQDVTREKRTKEALRASQERYRVLVENSPDMIATHDGEKYLFINPAGLRLLGAEKQEDVLGKPVTQFLHPDSHDVMQIRLGQLQNRTENIPLVEVKLLRLDGTVVDAESSGHTLVHEGRTLMQIVVRDITRRKQAEKALRTSESQIRLALQGAPIALSHQDTDLRYTWAFNASIGFCREEIVGSTDDDLFAAEDAALLTTIKRRVLASGSGAREEVCLEIGRERRCYDLTVEPLRDERGGTTGVQCAIHDITRQKRMAEELYTSEERAWALLNAPQESALLLDRERTILALNEVAAGRFGRSTEDLIGKQVDYLLPRDLAIARREKSEMVFTSGRPLHFLDERDGRAFENTLFPVRDAGGNVHQLAIFARDVTMQKQLEAARREACDRIRRSVDALTIQSDGIRQPLQVILALADLMDDEETGGKIRNQIRRIDALIREIDRGGAEFSEIREALRRVGPDRETSLPGA